MIWLREFLISQIYEFSVYNFRFFYILLRTSQMNRNLETFNVYIEDIENRQTKFDKGPYFNYVGTLITQLSWHIWRQILRYLGR